MRHRLVVVTLAPRDLKETPIVEVDGEDVRVSRGFQLRSCSLSLSQKPLQVAGVVFEGCLPKLISMSLEGVGAMENVGAAQLPQNHSQTRCLRWSVSVRRCR
ncbi:unnamed protein product [Symbiodinium sp. KB8]|nr:unnamed protein product [Symbiodinium sp. KB8]